MHRLVSGVLALVLTAVTASACGSTAPPTPTAAPCWIAFIGEYQLTSDGGVPPPPEQLNDAARTIDARLRAMGVAEFTVTPVPPNRIVVALPGMGDMEAARRLVSARGDVDFVPLPANQSVEVGNPIPAGLTPLFGREGITSAAPARDVVDRPAVDLVLTADASAILDAHANAHFGEVLAITHDGTVISAPTLNARSFDGRLQISGGFDNEAAVNALVTLLRLPPLPGEIVEVSFNEVARAPNCNAGG